MNMTHEQLIDVAYIAATYLAVGAFAIVFYTMCTRRRTISAAHALSQPSLGADGAHSQEADRIPMSFVKFSELAPATTTKSLTTPARTATRPVTQNERDAVLKLVRERLREVSPAERLADAMSKT